jgi:hypothetical protein
MARYSITVRALIASSLGLPGMQDLPAQEAPDQAVTYRFTHYNEDPLPKSKLAFGDPRRYEIKSHQLRFGKNLNDTWSLNVDYLHEAMSGSSPWYVVPGEDGPLQVMSGATISERRDQVDVAISARANQFTHTATLGYSTENDYQSVYAKYAGEKETSEGSRTILWGFSYSDDEITPTDAILQGRIPFAKRDSISASLALTQIINRNAMIQTGINLTRHSGYLSDPYKLVWIDREVVSDSRPDDRQIFSWTTRFRQYMGKSKAALHLNYRYFQDDWEIKSSTLEAAWHQPVGDHWEIAPRIRYYSQSAPDFYANYFFTRPQNGLWSSDYRLATYGALSFRLNTVFRREKWSLSLGAEYYDSDAGLALSGNPQDTPALVDFWRFTAGFEIRL